MNRMLGEGSVMQLLGAMAILLHLVASGQNDGEGIPMLVSGGQFRPRMAAVQQLVYHICPNGQDDREGDHSASY